MKHITLGPEGPSCAPLGIGTWAWGDSWFWSYGQDYGHTQLREAFEAALKGGVTLFDTAEIYGLGESERLIGEFIRQTSAPVQVATKYFPLPWRFTPAALAAALTASLQRLGVGRVTLYQIHWPFDFFLGQPALMQALAQEVRQGRVEAVGVSNYSADQLQRAHRLLADQGVRLATNQVPYSLLNRRIETDGTLETARQLGVTTLAYSPLAQGLLTGKYRYQSPTRPSGARNLSPRFSSPGLKDLEPLLLTLEQIAQNHQATPAQVALNWLISQGTVPIPGAKNRHQAQENSAALTWELKESEVEQLSAHSPGPF